MSSAVGVPVALKAIIPFVGNDEETDLGPVKFYRRLSTFSRVFGTIAVFVYLFAYTSFGKPLDSEDFVCPKNEALSVGEYFYMQSCVEPAEDAYKANYYLHEGKVNRTKPHRNAAQKKACDSGMAIPANHYGHEVSGAVDTTIVGDNVADIDYGMAVQICWRHSSYDGSKAKHDPKDELPEYCKKKGNGTAVKTEVSSYAFEEGKQTNADTLAAFVWVLISMAALITVWLLLKGFLMDANFKYFGEKAYLAVLISTHAVELFLLLYLATSDVLVDFEDDVVVSGFLTCDPTTFTWTYSRSQVNIFFAIEFLALCPCWIYALHLLAGTFMFQLKVKEDVPKLFRIEAEAGECGGGGYPVSKGAPSKTLKDLKVRQGSWAPV